MLLDGGRRPGVGPDVGPPPRSPRPRPRPRPTTAKPPRRGMPWRPMPPHTPARVVTARRWPNARAAAGPARGDAMACSTRSGRLPPVGSSLLAGPSPTLPRVADRRHRPSRVYVTPLLEPLDCRTPGRTMGPEPLSRRANMRAAQRMPAPAAPGARLTAPSLTPLERRSCWSPFPPRIRAAGRGSAHRPAPGRFAYLRSLSRSMPLRPCSGRRRVLAVPLCCGRSSPSASSQ